MNIKFLIRIFLISGSLIVFPIVLYILQFAFWHKTTFLINFNLSDRQDICGQFGDFMNVWVSIASLLLISTLTIMIHLNELRTAKRLKKLEDEKESERAKQEAFRIELEVGKSRPILSCRIKQGRFIMKNVGNGPALNIVYSIASVEREEDLEMNMARCHSLAVNDEYSFLIAIDDIIVYIAYEDIYGKKISSEYQNSETVILINKDIFERSDLRYKFDYVNYLGFPRGFRKKK